MRIFVKYKEEKLRKNKEGDPSFTDDLTREFDKFFPFAILIKD